MKIKKTTTDKELQPYGILEIGTGFWAAKILMSAVELGIFSELAKGPQGEESIGKCLGLHPGSVREFLNALVVSGLLERENDVYSNTLESDFFLDKAKPSYVGGMLKWVDRSLYPIWDNLTEALQHGGQIQKEDRGVDSVRQRCGAMTGVSMGSSLQISRKFPWKDYRTFADLGTAEGGTPVQLALAHPHLKGIGVDEPLAKVVFEEYVASFGLSDRLSFQGIDFLQDPLPKAEVMVVGHVLHDWPAKEKIEFLKKIFDALPKGGGVIIFDPLVDDVRGQNPVQLFMSLTMIMKCNRDVFYSGADCRGWMRKVGFSNIQIEPLVGFDSMLVGFK